MKDKVHKEDAQAPTRTGKRQKAWECKPNKNGYHDFQLILPDYGAGSHWKGAVEQYYIEEELKYEKAMEKRNNETERRLWGWLWKPSRQYKCAKCNKRGWNKKRVAEAMEAMNPLPCPHGRLPMDGQHGYRHCPHCLGLNQMTNGK